MKWNLVLNTQYTFIMIEYLSAERAPPIQIHQQVQVVYIDDCADMSTDKLPWP